MDKKSREFEVINLDNVLKVVKKAYNEKEIQVEELDAEINEMNKHYSEENFELYTQMVVATDRSKQLHRQIRDYKRALNAPYFGRVDFQEQGEKKQRIYIGRGAVSENNELLVIDWRTPVANLYYEGENGSASYMAPDGEIKGEMSLKRTFNIVNGTLQDYYDADVVTNDELLQEYLAKNADVVLRDIVATIQADQNEIIRVENWRNVIVQGVAGSGKTTVALHRLSWLIFNTDAGENRYLIIGSNRMFLNYVSGMLPDLGVESIRQMMMRQLLLYVLFYDAEKCIVATDMEWKSKPEYANKIEEFMNRYQSRIFLEEDTVLEGEVFLSASEAAENFDLKPYTPMRERAERFRELLEYRMRMYFGGVYQRIEEHYDELLSQTDDRAEREKIYDDKYAHLKRATAEAKKLPTTYAKRLQKVTEQRIYAEFLKELQKEAEECGDKARVKDIKTTIANLRRNTYDLYDLASLMIISAQLDTNTRVAEFDHIVIDEAQDFGAMMYRCLTRAFPNAKFTVLGDLAQNIYGGSGLTSWSEIEHYFPNLYFHALTKSYRNTIEIAAFANRILDHIGTGYEIEPVVRHGREVEFRQARDKAECARFCADAIKNSLRKGSAAIICRDDLEAEFAFDAVGGELDAMLMLDDSVLYEGGTVITTVRMIKGLEFDTVAVFDAGCGVYKDDIYEAKQLYVALTRALHELNIFYTGECAKVLEKVQ